jgi:hypothetical protein
MNISSRLHFSFFRSIEQTQNHERIMFERKQTAGEMRKLLAINAFLQADCHAIIQDV